jgi:hypothetical protein
VHNEELHILHSSNDKYTHQGEWGERSELWNAYKIIVETPEMKIQFDGLNSSNS